MQHNWLNLWLSQFSLTSTNQINYGINQINFLYSNNSLRSAIFKSDVSLCNVGGNFYKILISYGRTYRRHQFSKRSLVRSTIFNFYAVPIYMYIYGWLDTVVVIVVSLYSRNRGLILSIYQCLISTQTYIFAYCWSLIFNYLLYASLCGLYFFFFVAALIVVCWYSVVDSLYVDFIILYVLENSWGLT